MGNVTKIKLKSAKHKTKVGERGRNNIFTPAYLQNMEKC